MITVYFCCLGHPVVLHKLQLLIYINTINYIGIYYVMLYYIILYVATCFIHYTVIFRPLKQITKITLINLFLFKHFIGMNYIGIYYVMLYYIICGYMFHPLHGHLQTLETNNQNYIN
jgi:uncharacterized membrane protein YhaH (DUF805 family)